MKVLLDTNVLIGFFRNPHLKVQFESQNSRPLLFMSSVVALELFAGCRTARQEKGLTSFLKPFEKKRVDPSDAGSCTCFREAGRVLAGLGRDSIGTGHRRQIVNDVLIAVTAAKAGVVVVTANPADLALIEKHTPVRWMSLRMAAP